ncbi:MAG: alpha/beta hydrolase [Treponema sp.]|jgi:alpha-beta hydrolase superfamily lysophospholipase|nr:alpha/beta hydrolase [Treponema sp.]
MDNSNITEDEQGIKAAEEWFESGGGTRLFLRRWTGKQAPRAVLHIVHGMAEHSLRYDKFARRLCGEGIEVWAADQRGHGKTADLSVNKAGKGGLPGHCDDVDGIPAVQDDIRRINRAIKKARPDLPLFLMGHSWGSFEVQYYIEDGDAASGESEGDLIDGCILSGTRGPDGVKIKAGAFVLALISALVGPRYGSRLSRAISDGPFNRAFKPNRTAFDWLSRDEKEVDAYTADPASGMLCSSGFYRDLGALLKAIHRKDRMAAIRKDLPVYVFAGNSDPVGDMGNSPTALVDAYRSLGIKDLEFVLYPGARHEMLNETNREEATGDLVAWLNRHIGTSGLVPGASSEKTVDSL